MFKQAALRVITAYQNSGGAKRWFGVECNFEPSCSGYTYQAIQRYGLYRGMKLGWNRLGRCRQKDTIVHCIEPVPDLSEDAKAD